MRIEAVGIGRNLEAEKIGKPQITIITPDVVRGHLPLFASRFTDILGNALHVSTEAFYRGVDQFTNEADLIVLAASPYGTPLAFGSYRVTEVPEVGIFAVEDIKMVVKGEQGKGLGRQITAKAIEETGAKYLGFKTQNPSEVASLKPLFRGGKMAPLDVPYGAIIDFSTIYSTYNGILGLKSFDSSTGITPNSYTGRLGDYKVETNNPRLASINQRMVALGLKRENGDSIFIFGRVERPVSKASSRIRKLLFL